MKNTKISRRSFLLGLAACSAAGVLTACSGSSEPASSASTAPEPPASSAASEVTAAPFLTVEDFPALDGSTACIPLMAQMLADTTGMDLEEAQSIISVSTTAYAWESFGLYNTDTKMLVVYEAPDSVKEELEAANVQLEQKPIGVDALVFIVNEDNPVTDLTQQQLRDIYAGKITNWKDVGGQDLDIVAFQRRSDSGSQTLFQKLLIQGGEHRAGPHRHGRTGGQPCRLQQLRQRHRLFGVLLHRPDVLPARSAAAECGRRDALQRHTGRRQLSPLQRLLRRHPPGCRRRQPGAPALRLAGHRGRAGLHQKGRLCACRQCSRQRLNPCHNLHRLN